MSNTLYFVLFLPILGLIAFAALRIRAKRRQNRAVSAKQENNKGIRSQKSVERHINALIRRAKLSSGNPRRRARLIANAMILQRTIEMGRPGNVDIIPPREKSRICLKALNEQQEYLRQCELASA